MAEHVLEVLGWSGHTSMNWNPDDENEVTKAREEFERLKAAGFMLFTVSEERSEFDPDDGRLNVVIAAAEPVTPATTPEPESKQPDAPRRRGRQPKGTVTQQFDPKAKRTVAVPRMMGG